MARSSRRRGGGTGDAAAAACSDGVASRRRAAAGGGVSRGCCRTAGLFLVVALQLLVLAHQPATAASAGAKGVAWWLRPFHRGAPADAANAEPQRRWWGVERRGGAVRSGGAGGKGKGGGGAGGKKKGPSDAGVLVGKKKGGNGGGRGELEPSESEDEMGTLVIGPEAGGAGPAAAEGEEDGAGTATRAVPGGVGVGVEEETDEALVGYASGGGDDDDEAAGASAGGGGGDDDGAGGGGPGDGEGDGGRWSYLEELEEEEEPEWVAAYAALEESIEDPPQARRVDSREAARAILRQAWARLAIPPLQGATEAGAAAEGEEEDGAHYAGSPFARQSKAAARRELYKRFLKDLGTDTRALGGRYWLDRDALVHLRGTALLCQRPEYGELLASLHPRFCRGVRLVVPTATHGMQEALAAALAHSVGAVLVVADHRRIAAVRRIALDAGVPKRLLGSDMVLGALLDLARGQEKALLRQGGRRSVLAGVEAAADGEDEEEEDDEEELTELDDEEDGESEDEGKAATDASASSSASSSPPLVIFLADKARPFLQTRGVAGALQAALTARDASSFFLLASEYDPDSQLPPLPNGGNGGHAHGGAHHHHHHHHPHFGAAGGLLAPPGSNPLGGDGGPVPNMTTLLGGGQSPDGGQQGPPPHQQQGGGPPRFGANGLPGLVMPWPGMPHAPNFNKGGPVLHVLIRPNLVPSPNANNAPGNGSVGVQGYVPGVPGANLGASPNPNAPPPGVSGFSPLFKRTVAELAEHFHELSRERLSESQGPGAPPGAGGAEAGKAAEEGAAGPGATGAGAGEEEADREEDDEDDDDEDVDSQEYKDRAAAEGSALAQLAAMLEMLNSNENFHRALQAHVNAQHQHLQHLGLHGGPGGMPMHGGMPPPPGGMPLRPPPPPGAPGGPGGLPPQLTIGPDGVPLFNGVPMLPAYQITFAFPPLNTQPPPPPPAQRERNSAAAAAATPPAAGDQQQQDGKGLPFARWFGKNRGEAAGGDEGNGGSSGGGGRRGKRKGGRGGRGGSSSNKEPAGPAASELPASGAEQEELLALFEDVVLQPTKDAALRARWDRLVADDHERYNAKRAWAMLRHALGSHRLLCPDLTRANALLYKVQLKPGAEAARVMATAVEVDVSRRPLPRVVTEDGAFHLLSLEALETALAVVCKASVPRPGTPVSRTREEVTALAQNRHEHALVANVISPQDIGVTYDMIGGLEDVKETLRQCVTYPLRFPHLYAEGIAADSVKGVLLFGPPGTGKTMLAKAVATEGGATFLSVDASVIESKWLGESEKNAKAVFTLARRLAPCVIYLDEVDSILSSRDQGEDTKYNTITSVKTTFMQEWDGLRTTADRVIVVASTNRPYALDQAVLRRMPRRILVDLPDQATREEMLRVILQRNRVAPEVNLTAIARRLEGYTGSDIREVCREAVVRIAHEESKKLDEAQQGVVASVDALGKRLRPVTKADFDSALEKLSASVAARGRELERVREWNSQFGEVRKKQKPPHLSMYL